MRKFHKSIVASSYFNAARSLKNLPDGHKARNLHGHTFGTIIMTDFEGSSFNSGVEHLELSENLVATTSQLDYAHLNKYITIPSDPYLAKWILNNLSKKGKVRSILLQSSKDRGVQLQCDQFIHLWQSFRFEAAHQLPFVEPNHKCGRMHGHSFQVLLNVRKKFDDAKINASYDLLEKIWDPFNRLLNYNCLNNIEGLENPTSELIAKWLWEKISKILPELFRVSVYETGSCGAHYDGKDFSVWKDFTFDSAVKFGDREVNFCQPNKVYDTIHGHTFLLRISVKAHLDPLRGWTKDFGEIKKLLKPILRQLDHHPIHENEEINEASLSNISEWILRKVVLKVPEISGLELYEIERGGIVHEEGADSKLLPLSR